MDEGPSIGAWSTYQGSHPKEDRFYLPWKPLTLHSSAVRSRDSWALPSRLGCWLDWSCAGLVQAATAALKSRVQWSCHAQKLLFFPSPPWPLAFTTFLSPLSWWSPSLGEGVMQMPHLWLSTPWVLMNFWLQEDFNGCFWLQVSQTNVSGKWKGFESLWRTKDTYGNYRWIIPTLDCSHRVVSQEERA